MCFVIGLIADIWSHGWELSLAILSSFPSWTESLQRSGDKPPSDWERSCLLLWLLSNLSPVAFISASALGRTHTHTHTHTHTQAHACIHTHAQHGDTNTNKVHRCFRRLIRPSPAMLEVLTVCTMSCPWGSLSNFPEVFRIFSRQLEAASSIACVVVVRCRVVNVEIHGRSRSQHTGALGPRRGHPFNDRPSQGKGKK